VTDAPVWIHSQLLADGATSIVTPGSAFARMRAAREFIVNRKGIVVTAPAGASITRVSGELCCTATPDGTANDAISAFGINRATKRTVATFEDRVCATAATHNVKITASAEKRYTRGHRQARCRS
jgi:hypothetical protein